MSGRRPARSVVTKLRVLSLTLLAVAALVAILSVVALRTARGDMDRRVNELVPTYLDSLDQFRLLSDANALILIVVATDSAEGAGVVATIDGMRADADVLGARLAESLHDSDYADLFSRYTATVDSWWAQVEVVLNERHDDNALRELAARFGEIRTSSTELTTALKDNLDADWSRSGRQLDRNSIVLIVSTLGAAAVAALIARRIANSVSAPVRSLAEVAGKISEGESWRRADEEIGAAEVRELAAAFNALTEERNATLAARELSIEIAAALRAADSEAVGLAAVCEILGRGLGADRCDIFTGPQGEVWDLQYGWRREGAEERPSIDPASREFVTALVHDANSPIGKEVRAIPDAMSPDTIGGEFGQAIARSFGYRAMISAPIRLDGHVAAVLLVRLDETARDWTDAEAYAVRQAGEHATNAIAERQYVTSLQALDRQKSEFLATASHELRTPLTSIAGYLELLEDGDLGELTAAQEKAIAVIRRNTVRLRGLIEDILVINRIEDRGLSATFAPVDVGELVERLAEELQPIAADAGVSLSIEPAGSGVAVSGVSDQLARALTNVVGNAVKFTPAGGSVTVRCTAERRSDAIDDLDGLDGLGTRDVVRIVCTDTGVGIPAGEVDLLSTRFFRASNATAQAIPGTGLGLSIVRSIVELHGGKLGIESDEGVGTTVTITLPRLDEPAGPGG